MCGIVAVLNKQGYENSINCVICALSRLEYRGYDSSGIAFIDDNKRLNRICAVGKITELEKECQNIMQHNCSVIIGHTRWATHGVVNVANAHPQVTGNVAIVHNGIIENYAQLRKELNTNFVSNTDSEIISQLIFYNIKQGCDFYTAFLKTLEKLQGSYAIAAICENYPDTILCAKRGSPIAIGYDALHYYVASDAVALASLSNNVIYLNDGDVVAIDKQSLSIFENGKTPIKRDAVPNVVTCKQIDKGAYQDYMIKEIYEESDVIKNSVEKFKCNIDLKKYKNLYFIACGSSYYVGLLAKYLIEKNTKIQINVEIASEFRYREPILDNDTLYIFISQSGETSDTLGAMRLVTDCNLDTMAIVNVYESSIAREAKYCIYTNAGVEMGVASTKTFVSQLVTILLLAKIEINVDEICTKINDVLQGHEQIAAVAKSIYTYKPLLFIGRGVCYPIAMEGALKMKEITYTATEGYPAGEIKHGPIAIVDKSVCTIVVALDDHLYSKTMSNMVEIQSRDGKAIVIGKDGDIRIDGSGIAAVFAAITAVHLLAYYTAKIQNLDVDKPRNLAKSVTVE